MVNPMREQHEGICTGEEKDGREDTCDNGLS